MGHRGRILLLALACAGVVAGCGLGPGRGTSNVTVTVTRGFGTGRVATVTRSKVPGSETVMRMLERSFHVNTRYGGGFVESINGLSGSSSRRDWFYYVNGIQASQGAGTTGVHAGDRIWWDLHDWTATNTIPAVVGSFPEPFVHGIDGKRFPTTLECAQDTGVACKRAGSGLNAIGVPVASQLLGTGSGQASLTVIVGTWHDIRPVIAAALLAHGPGSSGVYATFGPGGSTLRLLDPTGKVVKTLGPGAGLVAATADNSATPTWLITGTDPRGVAAAASALNAARLGDHFALAVQGGTDYPVPQQGSS
jgi:hypothetical protein